MGTITIVEAMPRDADALTDLMLGSKAYQGEYASILDGYRVTASYVEQHPTFVAVSDGQILGFYGLIIEPAQLDMLFVADAAQGLGIGARLVAHMLGQAADRGITSVRVVSHPPAVGFYRRVGARQVGTVPPRPPKVTWSRPDLLFDVPAGKTGA